MNWKLLFTTIFLISLNLNAQENPIIKKKEDENALEQEEVLDDIKFIKKATLTGMIRDAITIEPIVATIEIIDNATNKIISRSTSNKLNGKYSISFPVGENFRIAVKAKNYWDYVENLYIKQHLSIQVFKKDILLKSNQELKNHTYIIYDDEEENEFVLNLKPGQKIPINNLNFEEKETRLRPKAFSELDMLIDLLDKNKSIRIQVAGHADDSRKKRINNLLALRRANNVAKYIKAHGINEKRIEVKSYSNTKPLVRGIFKKAKRKNRRVEIIVL